MTAECRREVRGGKNRRSRRVVCAAAAGAGGLMDQYRTLRVQPGASEMEVKKAFRQLALQIVLSSLRESEEDGVEQESWQCSNNWTAEDEDQMRGMDDSSWDMWEEWMGWEGAGIRDYSSHINPYI
ncbi:hypothetical protein KSP39_PZI023988 [Platanthera zijinensis]|uniref:J domain-containing protein n=1 Tax=Platanthera zijinensis TaxID=2320716 RepID=A0AAP0AU25_9ASPA